jgi:DNA polymerase elongation subunit (family B)
METSLVKGRLINGWYEFIDKQLYVVFLERVGNRKVLHRVPSDLKPYCYATKDFYIRSRGRIQSYGCQAEFVSDKFVKLSFNLPAQVSLMKKEVGEVNFFEADIPFIRRYMIDKRIYGGGKVDKLKRAYMDIECDDSEGMPDPLRHRIISMSFVDGD